MRVLLALVSLVAVAFSKKSGSEPVSEVSHPGSGPDDEAEADLLPTEEAEEESVDSDESVDEQAMNDMGNESQEEDDDSSVDDEADRAANGEEIPERKIKANGI